MKEKIERLFQKVVSGILIPLFVLVNCAEHPQAFASVAVNEVPIQTPISIPATFGKITESYQGSSDKSVVFIQDSHTSIQAVC